MKLGDRSLQIIAESSQLSSDLPTLISRLPSAGKRWCRRWLWLLGVSATLATLAWMFRAPLLVGLAKAWIVDDPLTRADVIVVLDGGPETRPFAAARLYREGRAPKVLVMRHRAGPTAQLGVTAPEAELVRQILIKQGVAETDVAVVNDEVISTHEESVAVRNWIATNNVNRMIIPTDVFHTRRVRWLFRKQLKDLGVQVLVQAVPVREYKTEDWWRHEPGVVAFQNEVLKYFYYRIKY